MYDVRKNFRFFVPLLSFLSTTLIPLFGVPLLPHSADVVYGLSLKEGIAHHVLLASAEIILGLRLMLNVAKFFPPDVAHLLRLLTDEISNELPEKIASVAFFCFRGGEVDELGNFRPLHSPNLCPNCQGSIGVSDKLARFPTRGGGRTGEIIGKMTNEQP